MPIFTSTFLSPSDHQKYNKFVLDHPLGSIHQTWEWGLFQSKSRHRDKFWAITLEDEGKNILASALLIRQKLPMGKCWLYCPRGPLADYTNLDQLKKIFQEISLIAKQENAIFLRFDPGIVMSSSKFQNSTHSQLLTSLKSLNAIPAHAHYQPENTLILNIKESEEDLLKQMKPKGRYNIKVAQKHGVKIRISNNDPGDVKAFHDLLQQTTNRDGFSGHPLSYYQNLLSIIPAHSVIPAKAGIHHGNQRKPYSKLYLAEYDNKIIAGVIITYFKDTAIYYFGASGNEYRNTMAPYLLQWQAITDAKKHGYHFYDFLGIAPENKPSHAWAGVTDFKLKFGGERLNYLPAQEIVYQKIWYQAMKMVKKMRP